MRFFRKKPAMMCVFLFAFCTCIAGDRSPKQKDKNLIGLKNVYELAKRVLPGKSDNFVFQLEKSSSSKDYFEITTSGKKILIRGNNGVSIASGLNCYLKEYCNSQFSIIDKHIDLPEKLPLPSNPELYS